MYISLCKCFDDVLSFSYFQFKNVCIIIVFLYCIDATHTKKKITKIQKLSDFGSFYVVYMCDINEFILFGCGNCDVGI